MVFPTRLSEPDPKRALGIRARLVLLVVAAVVPLLALVAFQIRQSLERERKSQLERAEVRARLIAARIDDQLGNMDTLLIGLAKSVSTEAGSAAANEVFLRSVAGDLPVFYRNLVVHGVDGQVLGSATGQARANVSERKYFRDALARGGITIGDVAYSALIDTWTVSVGRRIVGPDGRVTGVVSIALNLEKLQGLLEVGALPAGSLISVFDANHITLARSAEPKKWIGRPSLDNPVVREALKAREGSVEFVAVDGRKRLAGFSTCTRAPWLVYTRVSSDAAFAEFERQFLELLILGSLTIGAILVLAWLMASRITRPIRQLAAEAAALSAGEELRLSQVAASGEIGVLAEAFNRMLTTLAQRDFALRRSEEQFRTLIEEAADGVFIASPGGVYLDVNLSGARMVGCTRDELIGNEIADVIVPAEHGRIAPELARLLAGESVVSEWHFRRRDGSTFPGEVSAKLLPDGRILSTVRDITERQLAAKDRAQFERKLQETQKLESLGVLAGGIAHDFNNILTGILGNASLASLELPPGSPVEDSLENIRQGSLRAAELCKQMLAYSGKGRFVVQKIQVNQLVKETAHLLQISISKQAVLRFNLYPELPVIEADATQIRQVIMNLVINASEAIGNKSGVISLNTGLTRVDRAYLGGTLLAPELPEGTYVYVEVSDTGCGISPETQAKIFEPFFTTKFTGRGLGLAAVLGIVRGHQGALKIYSEVGRGTTFKLLFPSAVSGAEVVVADRTAKPAWRGEGCVLVVDDEESVRSTAALMLRRLGFETALAADGRAALAAFSAEPDRYALVLMDLTMPHLDGEQAFLELRRIRPDVRVVLMSGFNEQEAISRFTGKGLASFLQKPFRLEALSEIVQGVLAGVVGRK